MYFLVVEQFPIARYIRIWQRGDPRAILIGTRAFFAKLSKGRCRELDGKPFARNGSQKSKREASSRYFGLPSVFWLKFSFSFAKSLLVKNQ
jgi:hypothetical protein